MAGKGRPKKPDHLKVLTGTFRKHRANPNEPKPLDGPPVCPEWLDDEAKAIWSQTLRALEGACLLTQADFPILEQFADLHSKYRQASRLYNKNPKPLLIQKTVGSDGQAKVTAEENPLLRIMRQYATVIRPLIAALGLSPLDRPKLQVPAKAETKKQGFEAFKS